MFSTKNTQIKTFTQQKYIKIQGKVSTKVVNPVFGCLEYRNVGNSELNVSVTGYGTMLFGQQHNQKESFELLNCAVENGINLFDTAEMYPVPQSAETSGMSEIILGDWMQQHARDKFVISCKVCGPSGQMLWIRDGPKCVDAKNIIESAEGSLKRLKIDYIDILHIHWPDRYVPMFGEVEYSPQNAYQAVSFEEQMEAMVKLIKEGKIRYVGLSNETPYGLLKMLHVSEDMEQSQKLICIQNAYSLMCRTFEAGLAECCHLENISLLAYSPLAMGLLTGKYQAPDGGPCGARLNRYKGRYAEAESRYGPKPNVQEAVKAYVELAEQCGMTAVELAIRFVITSELVGSALFGATNCSQISEVAQAAQKGPLAQEVLQQIDKIHQLYPNPTP